MKYLVSRDEKELKSFNTAPAALQYMLGFAPTNNNCEYYLDDEETGLTIATIADGLFSIRGKFGNWESLQIQ